ncbi:MAG: O-antigen ligase family protein [Deltaproteobacteria bacterium]|nr:O-antigen ligase family protein [Deltaproteobacteria bacterium]
MERMIMWGEAFVLALIPMSLTVPYKTDFQKKIINSVYIWIFFGAFYGILLSYSVWKEETVFYYLLRHLCFFYYALFFFIGYKWGDLLLEWLGRFFVPLIAFTIFKTFFIHGVGISISMWMGLLWMAILRKRNSQGTFLTGALLLVLFHYICGSGSTKIIAYFFLLCPAFLFFLKVWNRSTQVWYVFQRLIFRVLLVVLLCAIVWVTIRFGSLFFEMVSVGNAIEDFTQFGGRGSTLNPIEDFVDINAGWRIAFWVYLLYRFISHPLGIGLGTPLFDPQVAYFLHMPLITGAEYVVPAHNFFITFLVRLGIPFLLLFVWMAFWSGRMVFKYLRQVHFNPLKNPESRLVFASLMVFSIAFWMAFFNAVLESPLYAWSFWLTFGIFIRFCGDYVSKKDAVIL